MNSKVFMILRIILGIVLLVFGLNKFLNFLPPPEMSAEAGTFFGAIMSTKTFTLVAIVEIVSGLSFIINKYGALMAIILMSISVNIILFHLALNPEGIGPGALVFILNIIVLFGYKNKYKELLKG